MLFGSLNAFISVRVLITIGFILVVKRCWPAKRNYENSKLCIIALMKGQRGYMRYSCLLILSLPYYSCIFNLIARQESKAYMRTIGLHKFSLGLRFWHQLIIKKNLIIRWMDNEQQIVVNTCFQISFLQLSWNFMNVWRGWTGLEPFRKRLTSVTLEPGKTMNLVHDY